MWGEIFKVPHCVIVHDRIDGISSNYTNCEMAKITWFHEKKISFYEKHQFQSWFDEKSRFHHIKSRFDEKKPYLHLLKNSGA